MILTHGNTVAPVEAGHLLCFGVGVLLLGIGALLLGGRDPQFLSHPDQLRQRLGLHLVHDLMAMELDRDLARAELGGDLLVEQSRHDQSHHFALARCELFIPLTQLCQSRPLLARRAVPVKRLRDGVEQVLIEERKGSEKKRERKGERKGI
jgi:hypothetical protein